MKEDEHLDKMPCLIKKKNNDTIYYLTHVAVNNTFTTFRIHLYSYYGPNEVQIFFQSRI